MSATPKSRLLLTNPIHPHWQRSLAEQMEVIVAPRTDGATLIELAREADYIVVRAPLPEALFDAAPRLRGVMRHGAGLDMIPLPKASACGVAVANAPGANAVTVAEYALGQMLNLARHLARINQDLRTQGWVTARAHSDHASELRGKHLVIVGVGAIGQALAQICAVGLGMRVIGVNRSLRTDTERITYKPLLEALGLADYVVVSCPLNDQTRGLIGAPELARMKPGARIINVARGAVIDEPAMIEALANGQLGGAALDVFTEQPLPDSSPLRAMPQVLLSAHLAGITDESMERMSAMVAAQLLQMQAGHLPDHLANPEARQQILARWSQLDAH